MIKKIVRKNNNIMFSDNGNDSNEISTSFIRKQIGVLEKYFQQKLDVTHKEFFHLIILYVFFHLEVCKQTHSIR